MTCKSALETILGPIFYFIRVLFCYADNSSELCRRKNIMFMKSFGSIWISAIMPALAMVSCEFVDNDPQIYVDEENYVELSEVAGVLAGIPIEQCHLLEVHDAVCSSSGNGYDEEYTMNLLFSSPGCGVGENVETRSANKYQQPLRALIQQHLLTTKSSSGIPDPQRWLSELIRSDIQIYWPYSENWDRTSFPIITFDPEDDSEVNVGYKVVVDENGGRSVEEVIVDEELAMTAPVWVINRNTDASFKTLEILRKEDPYWGEGGGSIIVRPSCATKAQHESVTTTKSLILKDFKMKRNYDCWFAGASEFFVKVGSVKDFTASTEAELKLYNPMVTDFMIVVKRGQVGKAVPFNAMLISDWSEQLTHCAFVITEDDGGSWTDWKCTALVRIASKSYGIEVSLPVKSWDDIVWRGRLAWNWLEVNNGKVGHFGDVDLTFEIENY